MLVKDSQEMDFWTESATAATASVAAAGKKEAFMRLWRGTTFWDVKCLDAMGNAAVKAAFLHVCAVLNASTTLGDKESVIKAIQAGAAAMVAGKASTAEVPEQRVVEFRDELAGIAAEHGISPPAVIVRKERQ